MLQAFWQAAKPLISTLSPEAAHDAALHAMRLLPHGKAPADDPILSQTLWGLDFPNPVGLAAGFDKNALVYNQALTLGFGYAEAGTVTPQPQPGNPQPRVFRLPRDGAIINRLGFNNNGLTEFARRLRWSEHHGIVGANIGRNNDQTDAIADYVTCTRKLAELADYLVVNISSPNTTGLRDMQEGAALTDLLGAVLAARDEALAESDTGKTSKTPLLVKVAPDLSDNAIEEIAATTMKAGVDGLIVANTTVWRPEGFAERTHGTETGGLSGRPLFRRSTRILARFRKATNGTMPLIGVGGISSGDDAYLKIRNGANLVQLYTALVYEGPQLVERIKQDLIGHLRADGFTSIAQAVGADVPLDGAAKTPTPAASAEAVIDRTSVTKEAAAAAS